MSDTTACPNDTATLALRERANQLDVEIQERLRRNEVAIAIRDELLEMIATLTRKSRPRKPRVVDIAPATAPQTVEDTTPRPTVFAAPCSETAEAA